MHLVYSSAHLSQQTCARKTPRRLELLRPHPCVATDARLCDSTGDFYMYRNKKIKIFLRNGESDPQIMIEISIYEELPFSPQVFVHSTHMQLDLHAGKKPTFIYNIIHTS